MIMRILILVLLPLLVENASIFDQASKGKCVPIEIALCKDSRYNYTYFPNSLMQNDQQSLQSQTEHFKPLIKTKCNPHIQFFICSVFAPMCPLDIPQEVTSCQSLCEQVKNDCVSILHEFGIGWPDILDCDRFPKEPTLCMDPRKNERGSVARKSSSSISRSSSFHSSVCPVGLVDVDPSDPDGACASKCEENVMFTTQDKTTARTWMIIWGSVNGAASLFTCFTFLIDRRRFKYPQRCVFYLSLCCLVYSIPYLFPLFLPYAARACDSLVSGQSYLVFSSFENTYCLLSFAFSYFFATAASLWWLMFSFTWYLSAARKWVPEGVDACASYLHTASWGISAILTCVVLVTHKVDASELLGLCGVGHQSSSSLLYFSLLPRAVLLVAGCGFVLAGFASMCRERDSFRRRGTDTSKMEKLMLKTGIFCACFIIPSVIVLVCDSYHFLSIRLWYDVTLGCKRIGGKDCQRITPPQADIYLLGLMMSLLGGVACAMWVISHKTLLSWQRFICCGLCRDAPTKNPAPSAARPLLEPPSAPPPQPPSGHYLPMSTHSQNVWRPSKVV